MYKDGPIMYMKQKHAFRFFLTLSFVILSFISPSLQAQMEKESTETSKHAEASNFDLDAILQHELLDTVIWEWNVGGEKIYENDSRFAKQSFIRNYVFKDKQGRLYMYKGGLPMHLTRRVVQLLIVSFFLVLILIIVARRIAASPYRVQGRFANIIETLFEWCRRDIADPNMHGHAKGFYSFLLTTFFFILALNLSGLFPQMGLIVDAMANEHSGEHKAVGVTESPWVAFWPGLTVTGDLSFTATMSFITVLMIWITGFRYQGYKFLWEVVPNGVPLLLYLVLWPLEFIIGPLSKGFALMIRLLANMTAGHVIILSFFGFIFQSAKFWSQGIGPAMGAAGISTAALSGIVAVYFLELLVAFLQAFIFTLLTSLFVGSAMHRH